VGAVVGVLAVLGLTWRMADIEAPGSRTLMVGTDGSGEFTRIADAISAARAGDVVQVEPGLYRERLFLGPGVNLIARVPGSVTLARVPGVEGQWIALTAFGDQSGRVSGIRFESTPALPIDVALRVSGAGWTIDLAEFEGPMRAGVELLSGTSAIIQGSHMAVQGTGVIMSEGSHATLTGNVFVRSGRDAAAIAVADPAQTTLRRNVFGGYGAEPIRGLTPAQRKVLLTGNLVVTAEPVAR
jgi:hypothetical protein